MRKLLAGLLVGTLVVNSAAISSFAAKGAMKDGGGKAEALFKKIDTNNDGKISLDEFTAFHDKGKKGKGDKGKGKGKGKDIAAIFHKLDTNNDNFLSPGELQAGHKRKEKKA